ncbi:MAG TPA: hypothetical protein VMR73_02275, partial [Candidatus Paceibacterota bacterium]|nr:hypothetical protein [Candidatus Paceibacterota bacterium]
MFSIKEAFAFGFEKTKDNWLVLALTALVVIALGLIIGILQKEIAHSGMSAIGIIISYLAEFFLSLILIKIALIETSGIKFTFKSVSSITFEKYLSLVILWILLFVFATLGFICFIIP